MRTVVVYLASLSASGGKERVVSNLLIEWVKRYKVIVITEDNKEPFYPIPKDVNHITLNLPFMRQMFNLNSSKASRAAATCLNMIRSIHLLRKTLLEIEYDYLYVTTPLNAFEAFRAMDDPEHKLVISEHASIHAYNSIYSKMKEKIYPKAYCVSVPNKMDTEEYKTWGCNAVYIPHPITFSLDRDISEKEKIVLNVGRLTSDKQQDALISIWEKIDKKMRKDWELWIIGSGEDEEKLKEIISKQDDGTIHLFPATKDIASIYKKASVFAFTSRTEGFGMVLLEAMAFGVPCISFDCPSGPRDVIKDGKNGFLVENMNATAFLNKLEILLSMKDNDYNQMRENAYNTVESWSTESIMEKWDCVFK